MRPGGYKTIPILTHMSMEFVSVINFKMPTTVTAKFYKNGEVIDFGINITGLILTHHRNWCVAHGQVIT